MWPRYQEHEAGARAMGCHRLGHVLCYLSQLLDDVLEALIYKTEVRPTSLGCEDYVN